ncbi:HNH endonuclease [Undibacterium aquatile]|uniref:HNH endonuclease n=1 Tax=Undibacterium aquatile TaxID=1537398 RepID=A0ABR6XIW7_9BURK|nr:HNH endonuclease [Undibacterium aquatile]MBC3812859.1 HNH endonuclease [Undibacterium aquatile]
MNVVTTLEQIKNNIAELERGRRARNEEQAEYRTLIKRGTCFLPYEAQTGLSFAPSRFVGYIDNKLATHANNPGRDGRVTNAAINAVLGSKPIINTVLDKAYFSFCESIGVNPSKTGTFGVERKYWISPEVSELLDEIAEKDVSQNPNLTETEKQQLVKARIGQGAFRESLISMWSKCCVTGCEYVSILRASHIKPWRDSTNAERLDKFNGLLLSPNFDALFDKGLISFTDSGEVLISKALPTAARKALGCSNDAKVCLQPAHIKYMKWHRDKVFVDAAA